MATHEASNKNSAGATKIEPAKGKLGVMIVGMGAVATTLVAGVEAVRKGLAKPIGSVTQMGTVRLGKRTDGRTPLMKDFVSLADLNDVVFTGWDIFPGNVYEAASTAKVLDKDLLQSIRPFLESIKPMPAVFDQYYVKRLHGTNVKTGEEQARSGRPGARRYPRVPEEDGSSGDDLVRLDGDFSGALGGASLDCRV